MQLALPNRDRQVKNLSGPVFLKATSIHHLLPSFYHIHQEVWNCLQVPLNLAQSRYNLSTAQGLHVAIPTKFVASHEAEQRAGPCLL